MRKIEKYNGEDVCVLFSKINELVQMCNYLYGRLLEADDDARKQTQEPERKGPDYHGACRHGTHPNCFCWQCESENKLMSPVIGGEEYISQKEPECEHEWNGFPVEPDNRKRCRLCGEKYEEKPAKKECDPVKDYCRHCQHIHPKDHDCWGKKAARENPVKDELAERLCELGERLEKEGVASYAALADEARKWAVEVVEKWHDPDICGTVPLNMLIERLREGK